MEEDSEKEEKERGLDEKSIRNIFLDLSTIIVGVAIGFSVTFATDLGIGGIINFLFIGILILYFWWDYLTHRLKYVHPAMSSEAPQEDSVRKGGEELSGL